MVHNFEFAEMHKQMKAWIDRQEKAGWGSPEEQRAAQMVLLGLWTCAHNKKPLGVLLKGLADYTTELNRVRGSADK